jgi:hypothetical protein
MFHLMRRILAGLPIASALIGFSGQPAILVVPPALTAGLLLIRDRIIRRRVGLAAWPSDGFARHVLVDDLGRLLCLTLLGLPLFLLGNALRRLVIGD